MIIQTYLYSNKVVAQIVDPSIFTTRNRVVYSRPVTVYQGIDNPMQVLVKNQDQKYVNVTNYIMVAEIQDPSNKVSVATFPITWANVTLGQGNFVIDRATVDELEQRFYKLTFRTINTVTSLEQPIYVDSDYDVPLDLKVMPAYYNGEVGNADTTYNINAGDVVLDGGGA
jgi:hypothetical protein